MIKKNLRSLDQKNTPEYYVKYKNPANAKKNIYETKKCKRDCKSDSHSEKTSKHKHECTRGALL